MLKRLWTTAIISLVPIVLTTTVFADQAQTDLQAALAYNQQQQQIQQQQQFQQAQQLQQQQFALGTAGSQPYCYFYGTCSNVGYTAYNAYGPYNAYGNYFNPGGILTPSYLRAGLCQLGDAACPAAVQPSSAYVERGSGSSKGSRHHRQRNEARR